MPADMQMDIGWGNGYIGVPPAHPWYKKQYTDNIFDDVNVHGGFTYSEDHSPNQKESDGYWWLGFDTAHYQDTAFNWPKERVEKHVEELKEDAIKAYDKRTEKTNQTGP